MQEESKNSFVLFCARPSLLQLHLCTNIVKLWSAGFDGSACTRDVGCVCDMFPFKFVLLELTLLVPGQWVDVDNHDVAIFMQVFW
jgi:hypothetical protein